MGQLLFQSGNSRFPGTTLADLESADLLHERILAILGDAAAPFHVADAGCGDGAQCLMWARRGHRVFGAGSDGGQVAFARSRARDAGLDIMFDVACASALPWPDRSMDVVLAGSVLSGAADWRACLAELVRVLKPGGALCLGEGQQTALGWAGWSGLSARLAQHGLASLDHLDLAGIGAEGRARRAAFALLRAVPPLCRRAQLARPAPGLLAFKAA